MRQQRMITIFLAIVLTIAICVKFAYFPRLHGHIGFYFHSIFWICGTLITIISANLLWNAVVSKKATQGHPPNAFWPNRRNTFRIIYPAFFRPTLIVDAVDGMDKRQLEFPIADLSQEGGCFIDDGSLGEMRNFNGRVRFKNGDMISISGEFIRRNRDHVSIRFAHAIGWPTLLEEQRRVLVHMKPAPRRIIS